MMLQPGIIALTAGSGITIILLLFSALLGVRILLSWDIRSSSEAQLSLERKSYLVSTLVQYALFFEIISFFLFIYTADDIHNLLTGAMCATGSLNANRYGFPALYAKIATLFLASGWIALNNIDNKAEDYPITKGKYAMLLIVLPAAVTGYVFQTLYFMNIEPNVITSCCGVLFSEGGGGLGSSLASLPVRQTEIAFFAGFIILIVVGLTFLKSGLQPFAVSYSILSCAFFLLAIASIVSFISLYFYQIPTHHCPFDMLQQEYYYAGYPLYVSLFSGSFFGVMTGLIAPLKRIASLRLIIPAAQRSWIIISICSLILFVIISAGPMIFSAFTLEGY